MSCLIFKNALCKNHINFTCQPGIRVDTQNIQNTAMNLIHFVGLNLWVNSQSKTAVFFILIFVNTSCNKTTDQRIDTWKINKGLRELVWSDTFDISNDFNHPYLHEIVFIDSLMKSVRLEEKQNEEFIVGEYLVSCSPMARLMIDSKEYNLFRVDISGSNLYHNLNFVYRKDFGVIAKHIYGSGYIKLISRSEHGINTIINEKLYDEMLKSKILFPVYMPDTLKIFDIHAIDE